jgi:hypothetical protein
LPNSGRSGWQISAKAAVAGVLGEDRRGGDGDVDRLAVVVGLRGAGSALQRANRLAPSQMMKASRGQTRWREEAAGDVALEAVEAAAEGVLVDDLDGDELDGEGDRVLVDLRGEAGAGLLGLFAGAEALAVLDAEGVQGGAVPASSRTTTARAMGPRIGPRPASSMP